MKVAMTLTLDLEGDVDEHQVHAEVVGAVFGDRIDGALVESVAIGPAVDVAEAVAAERERIAAQLEARATSEQITSERWQPAQVHGAYAADVLRDVAARLRGETP